MNDKLRAFVELSKLRIGFLVLVTTAIGFFLGGRGITSWSALIFTLVGTLLSCSGSAALNNYLERDFDALMKRTMNRPLQRGAIAPSEALMFGVLTVLLGVSLLATEVNLLTAFLALLTAFLYVLVYTPLKRITWLNTTVGAIPGALPPLGGWAAATGNLDAGAWALFLILFVWQHPHFFSIAWMYRDDYRQAGFKMLPSLELADGKKTFQMIIWSCLALIPVSVLPTLLGISGSVYCVGVILSGVGLLGVSFLFAQTHSHRNAKRLLRASIIYLPILLALIVSDVNF